MEINLNDTVIPVNYLQLLNTKNIDWDEKDTQVVYDIVFTTMVNVLVSNKTPEIPLKCVKIATLEGELLLGAILKFTPKDDEPTQGTWELEFSTNEKDFDKITNILSTDLQFQSAFSLTAMNDYSVSLEGPHWTEVLCESACRVLLNWLDENATKKEDVSVILPNVFKATVTVEGDSKENFRKVISIIPLEKLTHIIKAE